MTRWNTRDGFLRMGISFTFGSIYSTVVNARLDGPGRGFHRIPLADD